MPTPLISLSRISRKFTDNFGLWGIDLDLYSGEVHVLLGGNGAGKSALMQILAGLDSSYSGEIRLDGKLIQLTSVISGRKKGILYQHQNYPLYENLSVAENLLLDSEIIKMPIFHQHNPYRALSRCKNLFDELGIGIDPEKKGGDLLFSERQLLFAARAYLIPSRVVIFDEPTAAMNDYERHLFFEIIQKIRGRTGGIFYISHRIDEIPLIGTRLTVLDKGRIVKRIDEIPQREEDLIQLLYGRSEYHVFPRIKVQPDSPVALEVQGLCGGSRLKAVNFELRKKEILGVAGCLGSGRSDLARYLFGAAPYRRGKIYIEEQEVQIQSPFDALKAGIALVPEDRENLGIFPQHDLRRNMSLSSLQRFAQGSVLDDNFLEQMVIEYIKRLGVAPGQIDDILRNYSGGNKQKVLLGRWFMSRSKVFILDEPTRGIDIGAKIDIYNAMNNLVAHGASILFISSDFRELTGMCDRILILSEGVIKKDVVSDTINEEQLFQLTLPRN